MAEIRVEHLHKAFGDFAAVKDSTFTIEDGSFFCLLGPSGCGKTTTLRMIAGLELPTSGKIFLDGEDVAFRRASERDIAFVFQLFALYPHMNVRKNIVFPLKCQGVSAAETRTRVEETARLLRIDHLLDKPVSGLSGGDRQRVALGRAIVRRPKAFLMDEPLGTLDSEFRHLMCQELRALHNRIGATTVYVTHDQLEAMSMADTIAIMNHGIVEQIGPPQEVYDRPATMFVADFVGSPPMNFLPVSGPAAAGATSVTLDGVPVAIPRLSQAAPAAELVLGIRPEHVRIDKTSKIRAEVLGTEYLGTTQILTLRTAVGPLKARVSAADKVARGDTVGLAFDGSKLSLFDKASGRSIRSALHENAAAPTVNRSRRPAAAGAAHG